MIPVTVQDTHHFDINMTLTGMGTSILMDGKPVTGVRSFRIDCGVDRVSTITLEVNCTTNLTGNGQVWIIDPAKQEAVPCADPEPAPQVPQVAGEPT